jgi:hypothetical protein
MAMSAASLSVRPSAPMANIDFVGLVKAAFAARNAR